MLRVLQGSEYAALLDLEYVKLLRGSTGSAQKTFSIKGFFPQFPADLVTLIKEILNGKFHFFVQYGIRLRTSNPEGLSIT